MPYSGSLSFGRLDGVIEVRQTDVSSPVSHCQPPRVKDAPVHDPRRRILNLTPGCFIHPGTLRDLDVDCAETVG